MTSRFKTLPFSACHPTLELYYFQNSRGESGVELVSYPAHALLSSAPHGTILYQYHSYSALEKRKLGEPEGSLNFFFPFHDLNTSVF